MEKRNNLIPVVALVISIVAIIAVIYNSQLVSLAPANLRVIKITNENPSLNCRQLCASQSGTCIGSKFEKVTNFYTNGVNTPVGQECGPTALSVAQAISEYSLIPASPVHGSRVDECTATGVITGITIGQCQPLVLANAQLGIAGVSVQEVTNKASCICAFA
jgi:hypothetical protein